MRNKNMMECGVVAALLSAILAVSTVDCAGFRGTLNSFCRLVADCKEYGYYCAGNRTCQCLPNYVPNDKGHLCLGLLGEKCKYDEHCVDGAYCYMQDTCKCKDEYRPSFDNMYCLNGATAVTKNYILISYSMIISLLFHMKIV
nr:unnamed protein product [Callosobruchus chinensis]